MRSQKIKKDEEKMHKKKSKSMKKTKTRNIDSWDFRFKGGVSNSKGSKFVSKFSSKIYPMKEKA